MYQLIACDDDLAPGYVRIGCADVIGNIHSRLTNEFDISRCCIIVLGGRYPFARRDIQKMVASPNYPPGGTAGSQAEAGFHKGMAVFTRAKGGLMYEASIGGQKFSFEPIDE